MHRTRICALRGMHTTREYCNSNAEPDQATVHVLYIHVHVQYCTVATVGEQLLTDSLSPEPSIRFGHSKSFGSIIFRLCTTFCLRGGRILDNSFIQRDYPLRQGLLCTTSTDLLLLKHFGRFKSFSCIHHLRTTSCLRGGRHSRQPSYPTGLSAQTRIALHHQHRSTSIVIASPVSLRRKHCLSSNNLL